MFASERLRAVFLSVLLLALLFGVWQLGTMSSGGAQVVDDEYAKLVGSAAAVGQKSAFPTPADFLSKLG